MLRAAFAAAVLFGSAAHAAATDPAIATATAVLESLQSGDPAAVESGIDADHYRQHNLAFPDGRAVLLGALPALKQQGTTWTVVRAFRDGDFVVTHSRAHFMGADRVAFDIFRFAGGKVVEHWDNLQLAAGPNPSGHAMTDGATEVADLDKTAANRALVRGFVETVLMGGNFAKLPEYVSAAQYTQHNPHVADGLAGLQAAAPLLAKFRYLSIERVLGQGNFVLVVSHAQFDGQDNAVYDLFRIADGRIVEHWDVLEAIPPRDQWKNPNGKF